MFTTGDILLLLLVLILLVISARHDIRVAQNLPLTRLVASVSIFKSILFAVIVMMVLVWVIPGADLPFLVRFNPAPP